MQRRRRLLLNLARLALGLAWLALIVLALRVIGSDSGQYLEGIGADVDTQHAFLHHRLHHGGPLPMRTMLTHTLYGFSLVDTVLMTPGDAARRQHAVAELRWVLERLDDKGLRARYVDTPAPPRGARHRVPHGVYYFGQRNLTLAALLLIDLRPRQEHVREFHDNSRLLFDAFLASPIAHLESYPQHIWPADNVVALYSLAIHDRLYGTDYREAVERWVDFMSRRLDAETGLMPSKLDHRSGAASDPPRGSSLAYSLAFLGDLAPELARSQYQAFREQHHMWRFGLLGVHEYPHGVAGVVDVDSGPIVLGVSAGASGLGLVAAKAMGDSEAFASLVMNAEVLGVPFRWRGAKRYLLGAAPITDAVIVWGKTRVSWLDGELRSPQVTADRRFSRRPVLIMLTVAALALALLTWRLVS